MTEPARKVRKTLIGTVVSTKMAKTIAVERERRFTHPLYGKIVRRHQKLLAHDEQEIARDGDRVEIVETRPMSRSKHWRLLRVLASEGAEVKAAAPEEILAEETGLGADAGETASEG
jgi:small subunit ribosomal protein S17